MNEEQPEQPRASSTGLFWAAVPAGLLLLTLAGWGTMIAIALDDPGFALEEDYYKKAVRFEDRQAQEQANARLGWQLELATRSDGAARGTYQLEARVLGKSEAPIANGRVTARAFFNARAADVVTLEFDERTPGSYTATLTTLRPGLWEFRFVVERAGERFTHTVRTELGPIDAT